MNREKLKVAIAAGAFVLLGVIAYSAYRIKNSNTSNSEAISKVKVEGSTVTLFHGKDITILQICSDNIVRVKYLPKGKETPHTDVITEVKWDSIKAEIDVKSNPMVIKTSKITVKIDKKTHRISIFDEKGNLVLKESDDANFKNNGVKLQYNNAEDKFYGINGYSANESSEKKMLRSSSIMVTAGSQGNAGAPFVWSTSGYGLIVDSDGGDFNIGDKNLVFKNSSKADTEYYVMLGKPTEILEAAASISGRSPMFPKWAQGFTNSEWGIDQKELIEHVTTYRSKNIPIDNFTLDFDWKDWGKDNYGEFRWNEEKFPDGSSGKLKEIMDKAGIKLTGIQKPRIHVDTVQGKYADEHKFWHPNSAPSPDYFSNLIVNNLNFADPECRRWYFEHSKNALDKGMVGWWNDEADEFYDNMEFLNMQKGLYEGQRDYNNNRVWSLNRNFYLGAQRYAYGMWSGDIATGFYSMANQRERMLSAINLGQSKWSMDTGGFNGGDPDSQNYARWVEFSAFTPIFRVHGNKDQQRQPWHFGPTAEAAAKKAITLRYKLIPYIYSYDRRAYETGVGLVKPLIFDYPQDKNVENYVDAWMFGDYILVSPVVEENQTSKSIYLPQGTWTDYFTGRVYQGEKTIDYSINSKTWDDIPLFIKQGAIIPSQDVMNYIGEKPVDNIYLDIFPDSMETTFSYYDDDGTTYDYEKGIYFKQKITALNSESSIEVGLGDKSGSYSPETKYYILKIHGKSALEVKATDKALKATTSLDSLMKVEGEAYAAGKDQYGDVTYVKVRFGESKKVQIK